MVAVPLPQWRLPRRNSVLQMGRPIQHRHDRFINSNTTLVASPRSHHFPLSVLKTLYRTGAVLDSRARVLLYGHVWDSFFDIDEFGPRGWVYESWVSAWIGGERDARYVCW